jgi:hypothetical protein
MSNWQTVFKTTVLHQAEIVKSVLHDLDIRSVIVNKKDSSYLVFGQIELKVESENVIKSLKIIEEDINFE